LKKQEAYLEQFPDLKKNEFRLLAFMAYYGELHPYDNAATAYRRHFKLSQSKFNEELDSLKEQGFVDSSCYVKPFNKTTEIYV